MRIALAIAALASASAPAAQATPAPHTAPATAPVTWQIDAVHSELSFRIRHLVGKVRGTFQQWSGTITADPAALDKGSVSVTIKSASVFTDNPDRDKHLKSPDFFSVEQFPELTFVSKSVSVKGDKVTLSGDLTIRGTTKPVTLTGTYNGITKDPWGKERIGFDVGTTINRKDFGLMWNKALDQGGVMLGDDVQIGITLEAVKQ